MQAFFDIYFYTTIAVLIFMFGWFILGQLLKRNDVADIAWGLGFVVAAWVPAVSFDITDTRYLLAATLVTIWGLRLSTHIFLRNIKKAEDKRYAQWRIDWGKWFLIRSFFQVFVLQSLLLVLIVSPVILIAAFTNTALGLLDYLGVIIWLIGFVFESVGDYQLGRFLKNPANKGRIMTEGLWQYTRHPNYFGEVSQWWGLFIIALSAPNGWLGVTGPIVISFLILKVSGIPMLERGFAGREDFEAYKRQTNAFFPWFKKLN